MGTTGPTSGVVALCSHHRCRVPTACWHRRHRRFAVTQLLMHHNTTCPEAVLTFHQAGWEVCSTARQQLQQVRVQLAPHNPDASWYKGREAAFSSNMKTTAPPWPTFHSQQHQGYVFPHKHTHVWCVATCCQCWECPRSDQCRHSSHTPPA